MSAYGMEKYRYKIREQLPLRTYERREEAKKLEKDIHSAKNLLSELMKISMHSCVLGLEFSGTDLSGNRIESCAGVPQGFFKKTRDELAEMLRDQIQRQEKKLDEIPYAKVITFDFRKKEVEANRMPFPNSPPEEMTILRGTMEITKAAGIEYNKIKLFVNKKGLPAFKIPGRKFWYAFPQEIEKWKSEQGGVSHAN